MGAGTEVKTDRRIIKSREAINKAFLELFLEKEFEQITINDIADRANVNRGTIYLHYLDKYDLLDKCIEEHLKRLISFCSHNENHGGELTLNRDLEPVFAYFAENFPFFSTLLSNKKSSAFRERLMFFVSASLLRKLEAQGGKTEIDHELNAQFMSSAFVGIVEWWILHRMPHPPEYMAGQLLKLFTKNEIYSG